HLVLETPDETACLRVEAHVVEIVTEPQPGMVVRPLLAPILPHGSAEKDSTGTPDEWLSAIHPRKRRTWIVPGGLFAVVGVGAAGAWVVRQQMHERAARAAFGEVRKLMAAGQLDTASERWLMASGRFPHRPEVHELSATLAKALTEAGLKAQR